MLAIIQGSLLSFSLLSKNIKIKIYKTITFHFLLYGCGTWTLKLREENRLSVFENRALRRIFGPKRCKVTREWGKLHHVELHELYSPNINKVIKLIRMRWTGHVAHMGEKRVVYRDLVWKHQGKRPLGRHRHRLEDNNEMDLQEV
jgi:hypothetical protein